MQIVASSLPHGPPTLAVDSGPHGLRAACRPHGKMHGGSTAVDRRTLPDSRRPEAGAKLQLDRGNERPFWMDGVCWREPRGCGWSWTCTQRAPGPWTWSRGRRSPFQWNDTNSLSPDSYPTGRHGLIDDWFSVALFAARLGSSEDSLHHRSFTSFSTTVHSKDFAHPQSVIRLSPG